MFLKMLPCGKKTAAMSQQSVAKRIETFADWGTALFLQSPGALEVGVQEDMALEEQIGTIKKVYSVHIQVVVNFGINAAQNPTFLLLVP
jgi:hypothetical protein